MELDRNSIFYKITNALVYNNDLSWKLRYNEVSLCKYFWAVVSSCFLAFLVAPAVASAAVGFLTMPFWWSFVFGNYADVYVASTVALAEILVLCFLWAGFRKSEYGQVLPKALMPKRKPKVSKGPSLLVQWLSAKHRKICPIMSLKDE
jgi:hypothetical protein